MTAALMDYSEVLERFDPVLGLEVHVELSTATTGRPARVRLTCARRAAGIDGSMSSPSMSRSSTPA